MPSSKHQPSVLPLPLQPSGLPESPTHRERSKTRSWQSPEKHTDRSGTESLQTRRWGSVSTCARWRIPVVVGYAAARFGGMKRNAVPGMSINGRQASV